MAFQSIATNLVEGDTNGVDDVFVHDRRNGETQRVSLASDGTQGNGLSGGPSISADGRFVAFASEASNLVNGDTNGILDVFVHNRQNGETQRISLASDGTQGNGASSTPSISTDGRFVAFASEAGNLVSGDTNNKRDIFIHDRQTGETRRVSVDSDGTQANLESYRLDISFDGRFVAFSSDASNLVNGDTNSEMDIFVHDCQSGETQLVSITSDGTQGNNTSFSPSISADGRWVTFISMASNLVA